MVLKEENLQTDMAAPQVTQVALYRLRKMREERRRKCLDVCMKRGENCNTGHSMVRAQLVVGFESAGSSLEIIYVTAHFATAGRFETG